MPDQKDKTPTALSDESLDTATAGAAGFMTLPEVGDEVLVSAKADLNRPFIIAAVPNGADKKPE